jgi:F-type H+-transporting ATPase subunit epsilon
MSRFYVEGGFVEVLDNVVSVLTSRAVPAEEIDAAVAAEHLESARRRPASTPDQFALRDRLTSQARAQLRVADRTRRTR